MAITRRHLLMLASAAVALSAAAAGAWLTQRMAAPPAITDDPRQVDLGRSLYAAHCAECHGDELEGQPDWQQRRADGRLPAPPHDVSGHSWHHPDELLFGMTKHGLGPYAPAGYLSDMPAFEGTLTDEEIAAVIAFIKGNWPPHIRRQQERINEEWKRSASP